MPDALIISTQNKILLIEVKTIKIPPNIYTCENLKEFEAFLWDEEKSDFRKAVKTLETKVEHIINGNLDNDLKINSSRIKKIYPVLINLEEIPQSPYITKEKIWEEFENQNRVWREKQVARLQIVSSEELELLEDVLQLYKWEDLIDRRLSEPDKSIQELDFECFLRMLKEKYQFNIRMDSRYITKRWHQIFGRIIKEEIKRLEERVDPAPA